MASDHLVEKAQRYLKRLCTEISTRRVGSVGNQQATAFFAEMTDSFGFQTECAQFDCMDWTSEDANLKSPDESFEVFTSPYSLGCQVKAPLAVIATIKELEGIEAKDKILLLRGEIAKEQLMPKNFTFYNPTEHKHIYRLLEAKKPLAIVTATARSPEMAGAVYPLPMFEDGDFDIPSVFMTETEGKKLASLAGQEISLKSHSQRIPSWGCNVIARKKGSEASKVVLTAHIDARYSTLGALDNASGITVLLLLAELLQDYHGKLGIEMVAINGEDYYANPGEMLYLKQNQDNFNSILLNINIDDAGYYKGETVYSLYGCPKGMTDLFRKVFSLRTGLIEGEAWPQGDHMIFVQNHVPAMAVTSEHFMQVLEQISHTSKDTPDLVDCAKLVSVALSLQDVLFELERFNK